MRRDCVLWKDRTEKGEGKRKAGKKIKFCQTRSRLRASINVLVLFPENAGRFPVLLKQQSIADLLSVYTIHRWIIYSNRAGHCLIKAKIHFRRGCL
jgi:hypothetical protein